MKKVGDLMKEIGFKPGANEDVTKAFVKNLIREAQVQDISRKQDIKEKLSVAEDKINSQEQLSLFNNIKKLGS